MVLKKLKKKLKKFLNKLMQNNEVFAPVKKDLVRFSKIKDVKEIYLKENAYFPRDKRNYSPICC